MSIDAPRERAGSSSRVAERMRLYRQRRRQELRYVRIPLHVTEIDDLLRLGRLKEEQRQNPEALRAVVLDLLHQIMDEIRDSPLRWA